MEKHSIINRIIRMIEIFLFFVVSIALVIYDYHDVPKYTYVYLGPGSRDVTKELCQGIKIIQRVPYYAADMGLSFMFTTYGHRVSGDVTVSAIGEQSGLIYFNRTIPGKEFQNNEYKDFFFSNNIHAVDETLAVSFTATSEPGSGLSVLTTGKDSIPGLDLTIDGEKCETDLMARRVVTDSAIMFLKIIAGMVVVGGGIIVMILKWRSLQMDTVYVILAIFLGFLFMFIMTPLAIPDERTHYISAYNLSNSFLFTDQGVGEAQHFDFSGFIGHFTVRTGYDRIINEFFKPSEPDITNRIPQYNISYPLMYLPQAIGITLGRLLRLNFIMIFFLGRLFNLIFFVGCVYFAIRVAPRFKLLLCMVGLMPMALHQAASYSYDVFINGLSILLIAEVLKLKDAVGQRKIIEFLPVTIILVLLCPAKPVYAFMVFLLLLIPVEKVGSVKKYALLIGAVIVLTSITVLLFQSGRIVRHLVQIQEHPRTVSVETDSQSVTGYYPASFVLSHPIDTVRVFVDTLRFNEMWFMWLQESVGWSLAGLKLKVDEWHIFAYLTILIISSFAYQGQMTVICAADRGLLLFISAAIIGTIMFVMFVGWTPYGDPIIQGVQGRYFIPILPLIFMCFNNKLITIRKPLEKVLISASLFINLSILNQVILIILKD